MHINIYVFRSATPCLSSCLPFWLSQFRKASCRCFCSGMSNFPVSVICGTENILAFEQNPSIFWDDILQRSPFWAHCGAHANLWSISTPDSPARKHVALHHR